MTVHVQQKCDFSYLILRRIILIRDCNLVKQARSPSIPILGQCLKNLIQNDFILALTENSYLIVGIHDYIFLGFSYKYSKTALVRDE